jgi:hypothetical protein
MQTMSDPIVVSATLKESNPDIGGRQWLEAAAESISLITATLSITHPALYICGRQTLSNLQDEASLCELLSRWPTVFNGMSVISNRETPRHRDNNSRAEWYDILVTIGDYDDSVLELAGVGLRLKYKSGTMVHLGGLLLRHGVSRSNRERVCLAFYMRDNVHERMGVQAASWMTTDYYEAPVKITT